MRSGALALALLLPAIPAAAAVVPVAVAADFAPVLEELAPRFAAAAGHELRVTSGATGLLVAQIEQGAPHAVLLAADAAGPRRLEAAGLAVAGSRFTYARGRLVLWSLDPHLVRGPETLAAGFWPFLVGDALKLALAAAVMVGAWTWQERRAG